MFYGDFKNWSPYLAMEVAMPRWINEKTRFEELARTVAPFPPESERMNIEEMLTGYTINGAKHIIEENPKIKIKEVAFQLVFPTTANFCRYFKRATGIYPQAFKEAKRT